MFANYAFHLYWSGFVRGLTAIVCIGLDMLVACLYGCILVKRFITGSQGPIYPKPQPGTNDTVLVMVHGSGADERQFILARYLLKDSNIPIVTLNLDPGKEVSIVDHAIHLDHFIRSLDVKSVVLAGVSMGGLVISHYAEYRLDVRVDINGIVTIGTPFRGAPVLGFVSTRLPQRITQWMPLRHKQMTPGSEFLQKLNEAVTKSKYSYLTIGSRADLHVPDEFSQPEFEKTPAIHEHVTVSVPGHIALTVTPKIFKRYVNVFYNRVSKKTS